VEYDQSQILIVDGGDFAKRLNVKPQVITHCTFELKSYEYVGECDRLLIQFEQILRRRPDDEIFYEWASVTRSGLVVTLKLNWYDRSLFEDRKEAYRFGAHPFAFQRLGISADDLVLKHEFVC
jgi:hypothetical protein